ncbi:MAG TPA: hypothetical protein VJL32_00050 [Candidatus Paceibacterota bacterium]
MTEEREQALRQAVAVIQETLTSVYGRLHAIVANDSRQLLERQTAVEEILRELAIVSGATGRYHGTMEEVQEVLALLAADTARELESQGLIHEAYGVATSSLARTH